MRGGFFGALEERFAGDFGSAVRREWAVFGLGEGAARRFSARRTLTGVRGEKFFKKFLKRGVENRKIGVWEGSEGGAGAPYIGRAR